MPAPTTALRTALLVSTALVLAAALPSATASQHHEELPCEDALEPDEIDGPPDDPNKELAEMGQCSCTYMEEAFHEHTPYDLRCTEDEDQPESAPALLA